MKNIIIFDLDGTLALIDHRRHLVEKELAFNKFFDALPIKEQREYKVKFPPHVIQDMILKLEKWSPDWDTFYDLCHMDIPNWPVMAMFDCLHGTRGYQMYIFSGRSEVVKQKTIDWLHLNGIHEGDYELIMRPDKDYSPDEQLKKKWLTEIGGPNRVFCVFDDRDKVVKMWREQGITCFQVAPGNF